MIYVNKPGICSVSLVIVSLFVMVSCSRQSSTNITLQLTIDNKKYEQLSLFTFNADKMYDIAGKTKNGSKWVFQIPDSVNEKNSYGYVIYSQPYNKATNEASELRFSAKKNSDVRLRNLYLSNRKTRLQGQYVESVSDNIGGLVYLPAKMFVTHTTINSDVIDLSLNEICQSDLEVNLTYPTFGSTKKYTLEERMNIIENYPNSYYLMDALPTLQYDKKEVNQLFDAFSDVMRHSQMGQYIFEWINKDDVLPVMLDTLHLVNSSDGELQPVVRDHFKYALVIFSASWCGPLLKQIYNKAKAKLDITFISTDKLANEKAWNEVMKKEAVPWRSLFARDQRLKLYNQYEIKFIPLALLIHPDGIIEKIDVRKSADKERLFELLQLN